MNKYFILSAALGITPLGLLTVFDSTLGWIGLTLQLIGLAGVVFFFFKPRYL